MYIYLNKLNKEQQFRRLIEDEFEIIVDSFESNLFLKVPEIQGDVYQIAKLKAIYSYDKVKLSEKIKKPIIIDDTSLMFNALNGLPGPYMYYF